jgi:PIN domain nuclease of toxin-antitoxin system
MPAVKLLLDTHALIWWLTDNPKLSRMARQALAAPLNAIYVSSCSAYEIAYKHQLGKLAFPLLFPLVDLIRRARLAPLPITVAHAEAAGRLPGPHRDPWDRLLIAQARVEALTIVTLDPVFAGYGVQTLW